MFFGREYDKIVVGSNGDIIFEPSIATQHDSWSIDPTQLIPDHTLPYWDSTNNLSYAAIMGAYLDIDVSVTNASPNLALKYKTIGTAPNRKFMVIYNEIPQFSCNNLLVSQEIIFNESDCSIEVHIKNKDVCSSWNDGLATLGVQNEELLPDTCGFYPGDNTSPTLPNRNTGAWTVTSANSEAYRFVPDGNVSITWYDDSRNIIGTDNDIPVTPDHEMVYTLEVTFDDCHGNTYTEFDEVTVTPLPVPDVELPEKDTICADEMATIDGTVANATDYTSVVYTWTDGAGNIVGNDAVLTTGNAGEYTLTVETNGSCTATFGPVTIIKFETCKVPEGISPNGDGLNDNFVLDWLASEPGIDILQIYDRRGVLVYEKDNYIDEFVGKNNDGNDLPAASYYYVIKLLDGEKITGWFQLVR
jgi:gliding motility-associated-like protein